MRLTLHTDYAIRTLIYLAVNEDRLATISDISDSYGISKNHMMKVAQELVHHGFVVSERGRNGGLRLSRDASDINLADVVEKMETDFGLVACLDPSRNNCRITGVCGAQHAIFEAMEAFLAVLRKYSLQDSILNKDNLRHVFYAESPAVE
ncbi:MAG: HTH-type transcriptional regulator NsrR [Rhodomicrobium sp.]|nr:MAG: HTH-type transcriptional regulator NsrR [Rhodomicrobium sp.]